MPAACGWSDGRKPTPAPGLEVSAFATGLQHPHWIHVLPNGDVTVAEALFEPGPIKSVFEYAMVSTMRRAAAIGPSPNRITLLRDADRDGVAEVRSALLENLSQPFGMALIGDVFYVGNTDGVVAFPYTPGTTRIDAPGHRLNEFEPGGHWTRSLLASPDGSRLYGRNRARLHLRDRPRQRSQPDLRGPPTQPGRPRLGTDHRSIVDRGQRARRPR
ncbi:hypothetical protein [Variovorax ginsengisoli]|uniref:Uncharacterized protein n=1 Tax=Variovorax ginsengisoli TaxID=363844 RepID=A0ABT8SES9_9BURK|nr:hypothetical protein [Variovorax ginsengisoli]MDN8618259.1 hypothetical protein [Variovorax ginsengisoli]MDO1537429.1 hypothetical protein [Variovorax ginsengisoli]